jgi:hypothetical protein
MRSVILENKLVGTVHCILGKPEQVGFRLPYAVGLMIGKGFDQGERIKIKPIHNQCVTSTQNDQKLYNFCNYSAYLKKTVNC